MSESTDSDADGVSELRWRYREAAAVLSYFDSATLVPNGKPRQAGEAVRLLGPDAIHAGGTSGDGPWILRPLIRKLALSRLANRDAMREALAANPHRVNDPLQRALEACITGSEVPTENLDAARASVQAVLWLSGILDDLPDPAGLRRQVDFLALVEPLQRLVGGHIRGRRAELAQLADYVGVPDPQRHAASAARSMLRMWSPSERRPLMISGPGGVGKSALVARFLLDQVTLDQSRHLLFAYIDFNRPAFSDEPAELLLEAARQIGVQYPDTRQLYETMRRTSADAVGSRDHERVRHHFVAALSEMVWLVTNGEKPFVLVLDVLEELVFRGMPAAQQLWDTLRALQDKLPSLRTIGISRAPVHNLEADTLVLSALDRDDAVRVLETLGVQTAVALQIVDRVGGSPLSLRLAADLVRRQGKFAGVDVTTTGLRAVEDALVQGVLLARILTHIHDPQVRRLAESGLVLRSISADIIREVLAGPCELTLMDDVDAVMLLEALRREVSLVSTTSEGTVRFRPDLRRAMLPLIRRSQPARVAAIEEAAVAFYAQQSDTTARAEEIYHRLSLDHDPATIDGRWIAGVEPYLYYAIDELRPRARRYLAQRLGLHIEEELDGG
jgi:hypothetical protein